MLEQACRPDSQYSDPQRPESDVRSFISYHRIRLQAFESHSPPSLDYVCTFLEIFLKSLTVCSVCEHGPAVCTVLLLFLTKGQKQQ